MDQNRSGIRKAAHKADRADSDALWDWNLESDRIHFSPHWISLAGLQDHELGNTPDEWLQRVHPDDIDGLMREIDAARTDGVDFEFRYRLRHKDGTHRWMASRGVVVRNERGEAIRLTGRQWDVTIEMVTDTATGLPNRLLLLDRLTQSIDRARRYRAFHFAVLMIDLGRPAGPRQHSPPATDPLLTAAARRLETSLRIPETTPILRHNDLVARVDRDQFAVLLDGLKDVSHAKVVADRMLGEMLSPFALNGREVRLGATIGIAVSATGYTSAEDVLRDAETALHRARVLGGSHCEVFDTAILKSEQNELRLEGEFEGALERREFELFYQPIVSLASNQVVGFEALVRWKHPVLGLIPPLDFISLAETTGFIVPLGNWILREACRRLRTWQTSVSTAADLWMSVNLSSVQLAREGLVEEIAEILHESEIDPRTLVLELTEGMAMENATAVKSLLMRLRAMGVRISIDDFGTGYSSLAYLQQLPVDALKVDRSFVRMIAADKDTAGIVSSLVGIARQLGLHVVAEGVEREEQLALLRSLPCAAAQGELFAKPLAVEAAFEFLKTDRPPVSEQPLRQKAAPFLPGGAGTGVSRFGGRLPSGRNLWVAASLAPVLVVGGFVALSNGKPAAEMASSPAPIVDQAQPAPAPAAPVVNAPPAPAGATALAVAALPAQAPAPAVVARPAPARAAAPAPLAAPASPVAAKVPRPPASTSFDVLHLHRLGSCRGRLAVSDDAVTFVASEGSDAFELKYADFLQTVTDEVLTLKTAGKTYRLKTASADENDSQAPPVRAMFDRIERFRAR